MKFPSLQTDTRNSSFASSPTQIVELYVHRIKVTPSAFNAYPPAIPRHATMMAAGVDGVAVGQKPGLITVKAHGNTLFANIDRAFSTTCRIACDISDCFAPVGRGLGPGNTREKGVLLLETTLDVYRRKLAYQIHREHRFINVSTDEVGQLFLLFFLLS